MRGRLAASRVRPAHRDANRSILRPLAWLLIEWPKGEAEPTRYFLSTLPERTSLKRLVHLAKRRWRIERDFEELKQEVGLGHYEGRGRRGFHHHAPWPVPPMASWSPSGQHFPPRDGAGGRTPPAFRPASPHAAARLRPERHNPASIASRRRAIATALVALLPRCPCCLRPGPAKGKTRLVFMTQ
jgi:hypothetical protein